MPWRIADTAATVRLYNTRLTKATILNPAGYPSRLGGKDSRRATGSPRSCPENSLYVVLE